MRRVGCPGEYKVGDKTIRLDEECFLEDPAVWDRDVAIWMASNLEGLELTDAHWRVIEYLRAYWEQHGKCPHIKRLLADLGITLEELYLLFPSGPADSACKIAGTPRPGGCI
ncbi:MAG: TusE/DsrC/DsvC family sulfur relay protein [Thermoproteus sp.]